MSKKCDMNKCDPFYCEGLTRGHIFWCRTFWGWACRLGSGGVVEGGGRVGVGGVGGRDGRVGQSGLDVLHMGFMCLCVSCPKNNNNNNKTRVFC